MSIVKPTAPAQATVKNLMDANDLNIRTFSAIVGFTENHMSRILVGKVSISAQLAYAIEVNFGLDAVYLLTIQARWQIAKIAKDGLPEHRTKGNKGKKIQLDERKVLDAHGTGVAIRQIAEDNGVSYGVVWRFLRDRGVPVDPRGGKDQVPKVAPDTRRSVAPRRT
jgi:plasmid maintenance system antidote protein VapI